MNVATLSARSPVSDRRLHRPKCATCGTPERLVGYFALPASALPPGSRNELSFCGEPGHRDVVSRIHSELCVLAMPSSSRRTKRLARVKNRYRKAYLTLQVPGALPTPDEVDRIG